jgi:uncharacterized membrane protein
MTNPRKLAIALAISVGLNLFLGAFFVARIVLRHHHAHQMGPHPMDGPMGMLHDVDDPKVRKYMQQMFERQREHFEHDREQIREARQKVAHALEREPPDHAQLEAAFTELRSATTASQANLHHSLIELAPKLTPEQRVKLIKRWAKGKRPRKSAAF